MTKTDTESSLFKKNSLLTAGSPRRPIEPGSVVSVIFVSLFGVSVGENAGIRQHRYSFIETQRFLVCSTFVNISGNICQSANVILGSRSIVSGLVLWVKGLSD